MNKNQVEGAVRQAAGHVEEGLAKATGSAELLRKAAEKKAVGDLQKAAGDLQAAASEAERKMLEDERRPKSQ